MRIGDTLTCRIDALAYGGDGIARISGQVLFVPLAAAGDLATVRVSRLKKNFARAELVTLDEPSADRIEPSCRVAAGGSSRVRVPGCVYDHISYKAELRAKESQLDGFLRKLARFCDSPLASSCAAPSPLHYRNKIVLHAARSFAGFSLGYRQEPEHTVLDMQECPLACDPLNLALKARRSARAFDATPDGASVTFRYTAHDGALSWADAGAPPTALPDLLTESSPAGPLRVPRDGFYQVNAAVSDALVRDAATWFAGTPSPVHLLDLYCGVGVFGFACAATGKAESLIGVEAGRAAVGAARLNARALGYGDASFLCRAFGRERVALGSLIRDPRHTTVIVDPPREGLSSDVVRELARMRLARIFYVSCDPATLTRDLAVILESGAYRLSRVRLFDMFPRTAHFETLAEILLR